jgi:hypothetical protein
MAKSILSLCITMFQHTYNMNDGKLEYVKSRKVGVKNRVSVLHSNILQRAHQWARFCMKKHLGAILPSTLFVACARVPESDLNHPIVVHKYRR